MFWSQFENQPTLPHSMEWNINMYAKPNLRHSSQYTHISQGKCLYRLYFLCYTCDPAAQQEFCMSFPTACMACRPFILKVRVRGGMVLHDPHHCMFSVRLCYRQLQQQLMCVWFIVCMAVPLVSHCRTPPPPFPLPPPPPPCERFCFQFVANHLWLSNCQVVVTDVSTAAATSTEYHLYIRCSSDV